MAEQRDAPATEGAGSDGAAARAAYRSEGAARPRQAHVEYGLDATDPLLEVPQAHAVRTRPMRALRFRVRRQHRRRVRERSQTAVSYDVDDPGVLGAAEAFTPRDRRGSAPRQRRDDLRPRPAAGKRALGSSVPMPDVRAVRVGAVDGMRLRRPVRPDVLRHARVSGLRVPSSVGCGCVPGLQSRLHAVRRSERLRVRVPAVRRPRHLRCGPLFMRRLVRGLISPQYQIGEPSKKPFIVRPRPFVRRRKSRVARNPTHDETETPSDLEPEDILSGPLVDVPDAVRGHLREPSRRRGRGERAQRPHGHDLGPRRQSGPGPRLVPPRRIRRTDARGMAGPGRADPRALAREAEALPPNGGPPHDDGPRRGPHRDSGPYQFG